LVNSGGDAGEIKQRGYLRCRHATRKLQEPSHRGSREMRWLGGLDSSRRNL